MNSGNTVPCATCGAPSDFFEKPVGPFCSDRCQLVDLGRWLAEDFRISEPLRPDHFEAFENWDGSEYPPAGSQAEDR